MVGDVIVIDSSEEDGNEAGDQKTAGTGKKNEDEEEILFSAKRVKLDVKDDNKNKPARKRLSLTASKKTPKSSKKKSSLSISKKGSKSEGKKLSLSSGEKGLKSETKKSCLFGEIKSIQPSGKRLSLSVGRQLSLSAGKKLSLSTSKKGKDPKGKELSLSAIEKGIKTEDEKGAKSEDEKGIKSEDTQKEEYQNGEQSVVQGVQRNTPHHEIVIDSSEDDEEKLKEDVPIKKETPKNNSNILEMEDVKSKLNDFFRERDLEEPSETAEEDGSDIVQWRMKLNPFRCFGTYVDVDALQSVSATGTPVKCSKSATPLSSPKTPRRSNPGTPRTPMSKSRLPQQMRSPVTSGRPLINNMTPKTSLRSEGSKPSTPSTPIDGRTPYYLRNFLRVLRTVMESDDRRLFDASETSLLDKFEELSEPAQKLYVRLFQRKRDWFRCDKIQYPKIAEDLGPAFGELVSGGYLHGEDLLKDFDDITRLLTADDAKQLAKDVKVKVNASQNNSKANIISLLKKQCHSQRTIFFSPKTTNSMTSILSKNAKKFVGKCVKLNEEPRFAFTRVLLLFCLTTHHFIGEQQQGNSNNNGGSVLLQMLLSDTGDVRNPGFTVNKSYDIFPSRDHLIAYTHSFELENEFDVAVEKKDYDVAMKCYEKIRKEVIAVLEELMSDEPPHCLTLPHFLARFSRHHVILRLASKCVDVLEKQRDYAEAVALIEMLLSQKFFVSSARGYKWERLIIDYERHIKDFNAAFLLTVQALKDPYLRSGHRLNILQRHNRLLKSAKVDELHKTGDLGTLGEEISEPREETIKANIFLESSAKNRAVFLSPSTSGDKLSHVEQHVIGHYKNLGFASGVHGEGSTVTTLFVLLFWDLIFMDLPNVFQSEYQSNPLDMFSDSFYTSRACHLDKRLYFVYTAKEAELRVAITKAWTENFETQVACVNWSLFTSDIDAGDLAMCMGNKLLGGICELFCKDLRRRKSGFPDLIVWDAGTRVCKIVEVKGPGDSLSLKQVLWLDVLNWLGGDAVVCHVTGVGGKRKLKYVD